MIGGLVAFALEHWTWLAPLVGGPLAMLPFAGRILSFLGDNKKWALPALAFVALGAWSIDRTIRVANLRAEIAKGEADRAEAVLRQKERDRQLALSIAAELAEENARARGTVTTRTEVIIREKPVFKDLDSPALRESDAGLLELGFRRATRPGAAGTVDAPAAP